MELKPLTSAQLARLKREASDKPNKILDALYLVRARQQDLVVATGLHASKISELVNGKYSRISLDTARRVSQALGACIEDIFPPACATSKRKRAA
jgi:plasmid maintenance system antidote protein VapI